MAEVADLFVLLRAETAPFARGMSEAAAKGESFTAKMGGVGGMMTKLGRPPPSSVSVWLPSR